MNVHKMYTIVAVAALVLLAGACSHSSTVATTNDSGEIRTQGQPTGTNVAVQSGPAVVDSNGNVYSSSAAGGAGNAANVGTNTNVQVTPQASSSNLAYSETPAPPAPAPVVVETPAPAPAPVIETPAPAPPPVETPAPAPEMHKVLHKE